MLKKILLTTVALLSLGGLSAAAQAVITFSKTEISLGRFSESQPQTVVFTFTNTGNEPLVIHQALTSCGCTVPSFSTAPIAPGKTGEVKVVYNGKGKALGEFKKAISVRTNASNGLVRLYIAGNMEADKPTGDKK